MQSNANSAMANRGVSVVVPTFNRAHYIEECLDSLLEQTVRAAEIIVVDDGSEDDTAERLKRYGQEIHYIRKENGGKPSALNLAMNHVRGQYVWIFDDDDVALPEAIERRIAVMDRRPELAFVYSGHYLGKDDESGRIKREKLYRLPEIPDEEIFLSLMKGCYFTLQSMLVRTSAYRDSGPFDEMLVSSEDYDMMLRLAHRFQGSALAAPTFTMRQHAGQRGPRNQRYSERERQAVFRQFDQIVGRKIRATVPLGDYLSPRRTVVGPPEIEREALFSRMVVMASKGVIDEMLQDLRDAVERSPCLGGLSTTERALCAAAAHTGYAEDAIAAAWPQFLSTVKALASRPTGRQAGRALAHGFFTLAKSYPGSLKTRSERLRAALVVWRAALGT